MIPRLVALIFLIKNLVLLSFSLILSYMIIVSSFPSGCVEITALCSVPTFGARGGGGGGNSMAGKDFNKHSLGAGLNIP